MIVSLIAAMGKNRVIGNQGNVPWHLPDDLEFFETKTSGHIKLMGRKTFEEPNFEHDPENSIILTRDKSYKAESFKVVHSIEEGIAQAKIQGEKEFFIIGGAKVYEQSIKFVDRIYLTIIDEEFDGDSYFPEFSTDNWELVSDLYHGIDDEHEYTFRFLEYHKKT
jgi:dihydrofolate reductase